MAELIYNVSTRSHTDEHILTKIASGTLVGFQPDVPRRDFPPQPFPVLPPGLPHTFCPAPHSRNTNHPTLPSLTHPSLPAQSPSAHHTPASPPPLPLLPQNGWGGREPLWSSFLAMPFTKPGLACGHLVTRETCTRSARRFSQRWSGWNACALARSSNIRCQVRVLMVIRDMAVAGKPGASCTSKLG